MQALDDYKRASGRMFPTCSEILEVVRNLGYVRLTENVDAQLAETTDAAEIAQELSELNDEDEAT